MNAYPCSARRMAALVAAEKLMPEGVAFTNELARRSPVALAQIKRVMRDGAPLPIEQAMKVEQKGYYTATRNVDWKNRQVSSLQCAIASPRPSGDWRLKIGNSILPFPCDRFPGLGPFIGV